MLKMFKETKKNIQEEKGEQEEEIQALPIAQKLQIVQDTRQKKRKDMKWNMTVRSVETEDLAEQTNTAMTLIDQNEITHLINKFL